MSLLAELNDLIVRYRFRPRKKLGQHFIINEKAIEDIVDLAELRSNDKVLEIGAGTGFLTREIAKHCSVFAVEIDEKLCELLRNELKGLDATIACEDFLKLELPDFNKVVSVPPYYISKKIMLKILRHDFELAVMVFQGEFAEKLTAEPGFPQYSAITVFSRYKADIEIVAPLSPSSFFPKPKAVSSIVRIRPVERREKVCDEVLFYKFVAELFRYRKKNLENALACSKNFIETNFGLKQDDAIKMLAKFDLQKKVDLTEISDFVEIFNSLSVSRGARGRARKAR